LVSENKAALGQTTMHRHLAALEADLVIAARTGLLALVTAPGSFAQARTNATSHATLVFLGAVSRFNRIQFHLKPHTSPDTATLVIMPRFSGVSSTSTVWCIRRSPRPRTHRTVRLLGTDQAFDLRHLDFLLFAHG